MAKSSKGPKAPKYSSKGVMPAGTIPEGQIPKPKYTSNPGPKYSSKAPVAPAARPIMAHQPYPSGAPQPPMPLPMQPSAPMMPMPQPSMDMTAMKPMPAQDQMNALIPYGSMPAMNRPMPGAPMDRPMPGMPTDRPNGAQPLPVSPENMLKLTQAIAARR